jgi:hypothetical protein
VALPPADGGTPIRPVADDRDAFISNVCRQHIIQHCAELAGLDLSRPLAVWSAREET